MKQIKFIIEWAIPIVIGLLIALIIGQFFGRQKIIGSSMSPNLKNSEIVYRLNKAKIKRNAIISFYAHGIDKNKPTTAKTIYVKRVIGMPGDRIRYSQQGKLFINGKLQAQNYIPNKQRKFGTLTPPARYKEATGVNIFENTTFVVPQNSYFVLGDNRKISNDGRYYGFVPKNKIIGVIKVPFWINKHKLINSVPNS
ncbi:signal peptidase I [Liquorilactobacillus capillatus]|uniref:signal peptidase I n=1 Tax=Liquorilactobacillus capillatus TaxID=480931 RepID=UPI00070EF47A|nr:signal peptidase I [Liquorilactobacillus capillatus]